MLTFLQFQIYLQATSQNIFQAANKNPYFLSVFFPMKQNNKILLFVLNLNRQMFLVCCEPKPQELIQPRFQAIQDLQIEPCLLHGKRVEFVCFQNECQQNNNTLLCHQCLKQHRSHNWKTRQQYFTRSFKYILQKKYNANIKQVLDDMHHDFDRELQKSLIDVFNNSLEIVNISFDQSIEQIQEKYEERVEKKQTQKNITPANFQEIKDMYNEQKKEIGKIKQISDILINSIKHIGISIKKLLQLLHLQVQAKTWDNIEAMERFQDVIEAVNVKNEVVEQEKNYFYFSEHLKHENIRLDDDYKAIYYNSMPSRPVAMTANHIVVNHNQFGFQIIKMATKAFFFQCTTIFIGICDEQIVKISGLRKINQLSKGAYLISSAGWSYHHKDIKYNRNENVGWTFNEGDRIEVEVVFDRSLRETADSKIIFNKKGRFYDSIFQMPLKLKNEQLRKLRPCVSFDADQGAIVRIYDIK